MLYTATAPILTAVSYTHLDVYKRQSELFCYDSDNHGKALIDGYHWKLTFMQNGAMTQEEYRKAACDAVRKLGQDVGIPADLKAIVKDEDVQFLAESAFADACRPGNPRDTSVEEIAALYRSRLS